MKINLIPYIPPVCSTKEQFEAEMKRRENAIVRDIFVLKVTFALLVIILVVTLFSSIMITGVKP